MREAPHIRIMTRPVAALNQSLTFNAVFLHCVTPTYFLQHQQLTSKTQPGIKVTVMAALAISPISEPPTEILEVILLVAIDKVTPR
jgi:hypothetical protein